MEQLLAFTLARPLLQAVSAVAFKTKGLFGAVILAFIFKMAVWALYEILQARSQEA